MYTLGAGGLPSGFKRPRHESQKAINFSDWVWGCFSWHYSLAKRLWIHRSKVPKVSRSIGFFTLQRSLLKFWAVDFRVSCWKSVTHQFPVTERKGAMGWWKLLCHVVDVFCCILLKLLSSSIWQSCYILHV